MRRNDLTGHLRTSAQKGKERRARAAPVWCERSRHESLEPGRRPAIDGGLFLAATGEIPPIDYAIFADTGEEPQWVHETVYQLDLMEQGSPILIRYLKDSNGVPVRLGDNLLHGNAGRFASIPAFIKHKHLFVKGKKKRRARCGRQCTREFKTSVVESTIRYELLGLKKGQAYKGERITQVFGLDYDEGGRIVDLQERLARGKLSVGDFPLWERSGGGSIASSTLPASGAAKSCPAPARSARSFRRSSAG